MAKNKIDNSVVKWITKKSKNQVGSVILLVFGNLVFSVITVMLAMICKKIIDCAVNKNLSGVSYYAIVLASIVLLQFVLKLVCNSLSQYSKAKLNLIYQQDMLKSVFEKDYASVSKMHSGEILNRMFSDVQIVSDGVVSIVPSLIGMITKLVCAFAVLVYLEKCFAFGLLGAGAVILVVLRLFRNKLKGMHKRVQQKQDKVRSFFQEMIKSNLIVKVFRADNVMTEKAKEYQDDYLNVQMKRTAFLVAANAGMSFVFQLCYVAALIWGACKIYDDVMFYGTLTAILQLVNQLQAPISGLSGILPHIYSVTASAERVREIEDLPDEKETSEEEIVDFNTISFENVDFSYDRNTVLDKVSFNINKGDFVSFTGLSGGGKSTMFLLMLGIYKPQEGSVSVLSDTGVNLSSKSTRKLFAYVPQENCLLSGTIRENIAFMNASADQSLVEKAAKIACADEFISSFPQGYDTIIGEDGFGVSEGQAQRIAIARAILSDAPILLFDESTSALDEETESKLLKNISELENKTCMIVTHRRAALDICNKHIIINNGKVEVVEGSYNQ